MPGLSNFRGEVYHTGVWPQFGVNLKGKRIAQIGTGASGIQVIQEIGDKAKQLTIYQRTPNLCLPMNQAKLDPKEEQRKKDSGEYEAMMKETKNTFAGFAYDFMEKNTFDDSAEEREKNYHRLMNEEGGFHFWLNTYKDMLFVQEANDVRVVPQPPAGTICFHGLVADSTATRRRPTSSGETLSESGSRTRKSESF